MHKSDFPYVPDEYWWAIEEDWYWGGFDGPCLTVVLKTEVEYTQLRTLLPNKKLSAVDNIGACAVLNQINPTDGDFIAAANRVLEEVQHNEVETANARAEYEEYIATRIKEKQALRTKYVGEYR